MVSGVGCTPLGCGEALTLAVAGGRDHPPVMAYRNPNWPAGSVGQRVLVDAAAVLRVDHQPGQPGLTVRDDGVADAAGCLPGRAQRGDVVAPPGHVAVITGVADRHQLR